MLQLPSPLRRTPVDPVERTMRELSQQGTGMARLAHIFATLMVVLFSLGSLVALSGESFAAIVATIQHGGVPSVPQAISIAVSTLMVVCCDIGLVYAAMTLRVLKTRGADEGATLHWVVLVGVSVIEGGTYLYMSWLYEHPTGIAWVLVIARALAAPLLSVYLAMARAHPVTPRDILHQAELAQGIQLVRDVIRVAQDPTASLADKMRLYEASAEMGERDKSRLQQMITVVQARLAVPTSPSRPALPSDALATPVSPNGVSSAALSTSALHILEADPAVLAEPAAEDSDQDEFDEAFAPRGRYNAGRVTARIEATR